MKIFFETFKHRVAASLAAAIVALLTLAPPASSDPVEGAAAAPAEAIEGAAAAPAEAVQAPTSAEQAPPTVVPSAPEPEAMEATARQTASTAEEAGGAAEGNTAASLPDIPPASKSVGHATSSSLAQIAPEQRASGLVEGVRHASAERIAPVTDRVQDYAGGPLLDVAAAPLKALPGALLDSVAQVAETLLPPVGPSLETRGGSSAPETAGPLQAQALRTVSLSHLGRIVSMSTREHLAGPSTVKPEGPSAAHRPGVRMETPAAIAGAGPTTDRLGSTVPPDVPLPTPGEPGAIAPGSGGPSFVPLAALLALLALVAPAVLRRFGKAPDFRPPTPFACALERPG